MTSLAERWCLKEIAARSLTGAGAMVDLGTWLGSLSAAMAIGASANPALTGKDLRIEAFDQFIWLSSYMDPLWHAEWSLARPADGESFLPAFQAFTSPWADRIRPQAGDLEKARWTGQPIELASVDALKSPALSRTIMREFYPALLSGAFLFHQDFCHSVTWWIHLHHFLLRDHFAPIDLLEGSAGVLFAVTRPVPSASIERVIAADLSDAGLAADAFSYSAEIVAPADRGVVAVARARCALEHGRTNEAERLLDSWRDDAGAARELSHFPLP